MDLQDFIESVLVQISEASINAQKTLKDKGVVINPICRIDNTGLLHAPMGGRGDTLGSVQKINFDIAVSATKSSTKKGNAGIKVAFANIGIGKDNQVEDSTLSRIKFELTLCLPVGEFEYN